MTKISLIATHKWFLTATLPVWRALPAEVRGDAYLDRTIFSMLPDARPLQDIAKGAGPVLCAGYDDMQWAGPRPVVLMEHGIGQSYSAGGSVPTANYAGGPGRHGVTLVLAPNEYAAAPEREAHPDVRVEIIGSPQLADWQDIPAHVPDDDRLTVAFAFHFPAQVCPEAGSAFNYWCGPGFGGIGQDPRFKVLGHGHPRSLRDMAPCYEANGIEVVWSFEEVLARADVLVFDSTSVGFYFAALRGPVVVLDSPEYRRDVHHGLRFWDAADIGPRIMDPLAIKLAVAQAWGQRPWPGADEILGRVFPAVESPADRAAGLIVECLDLVPGVARGRARVFPRTSNSR